MASSIFKNLSRATSTTLIKIFGLGAVAGEGKQHLTNTQDIDQEIQKATSLFGMDSGGYASIFATYIKSETERRKQYKEYDSMEEESEVIATALDIYAEDSTDFDSFVGSRVWITSNKEKLAEEANELLKRIRIEKNLPRIARNTAKYGDFFLRLTTAKTPKEDLKGIERIDTSYYPRDVTPIVINRTLLGYWVAEADNVQAVESDCLFAPWEFVHFAVPGDSNFVTYDGVPAVDIKREDRVEYGQSLLKAARKAYKRSKLAHDILAIARITRSALRRVFKFQTETDNPVKAITALAMFKKTMEKIGGVDKANEDMKYEELMNLLTQDIYIPILKDGRGDYAFESHGGDVDVNNIADIELFDNRLFMSLRIPKEYMNFGEGIGEKTTLLLKDIRYSKRIKKLQNALRNGIKELVFIHFALKGQTLDEEDFEVNMTSTSISEDLERLDYFGNAVQTADSLIRMLETFAGDEGEEGEKSDVNKSYLVYYIMKNIVKLPSFDITKFYPPAKEFVNDEEKKSKAKKAETIVENHKGLIESMMSKNFGRLREATAEQLNLHLKKEYLTEGMPEKWDHGELKKFAEGLIANKAKKDRG